MNKTLCLLVAGGLLCGCASFSSDPHPGKLERVGVLQVVDCREDTTCVRYSLLGTDMHTRDSALGGAINGSLKGRLIAVLGTDAGQEGGLQHVNVEQTRAITDFDYQPFLRRATADYVQAHYHCTSFWDQSYAWRLDGRQPVLIATLGNPFEAAQGTLELEYDGLTRKLLTAQSRPGPVDPCQLR